MLEAMIRMWELKQAGMWEMKWKKGTNLASTEILYCSLCARTVVKREGKPWRDYEWRAM